MLSKAKRFFLLSLVLVGIAALAAGCDDVVEDPTFRMWCGESLCAWKVEAGSIRRAPTWHKKDHGVELVDTPTAISQVTTKSPECLEFTTVADVAPGAQVTIGVDFNNDGTIDDEQPIAATNFHEAKTQITAPALYDGIRFVISKKGAGRAVLAQIRVQSRNECTAPPVVLEELPLASPCSTNQECRSGMCCSFICSDCCGAGASNAPAADCGADGSVCERRDASGIRSNLHTTIPWQCDPGRARKPKDAECLADDDCASNVCEGEVTPAFPTEKSAEAGIVCNATYPDAGHPDCLFGAMRAGRCK